MAAPAPTRSTEDRSELEALKAELAALKVLHAEEIAALTGQNIIRGGAGNRGISAMTVPAGGFEEVHAGSLP